jgi:aspartate/methionine/tyrosine aminotransferase
MRQFPASPITVLIDGTPQYNLAESYGRDLSVAEVLGPAGLEPLGRLSLGYGTSAGDPALREQLAARLRVPAGQILVTAGAGAALFLAALLHSDGEVVLGVPCFPPMLDAVRGIGAQVVTVRSRFDDGYRIDLDQFAASLSASTRLVMFASPQNPSGTLITASEVEQMLAAMSRTCPGAFLLIDETYREAVYGDAPPAPTFAGTSPRLLTCASLSKAHGAPGLRIGWLTVPDPALYEQLRLAKFNSSVACGATDEFLAALLLARADEILARRGAFLAKARTTVELWMEQQTRHLRWLRPHAGAFCCAQLNPVIFGPEQITRFHAQLAEHQTAVSQGPWFADSPNIIRIGLAYEPLTKLEKGLTIMADTLNAAIGK